MSSYTLFIYSKTPHTAPSSPHNPPASKIISFTILPLLDKNNFEHTQPTITQIWKIIKFINYLIILYERLDFLKYLWYNTLYPWRVSFFSPVPLRSLLNFNMKRLGTKNSPGEMLLKFSYPQSLLLKVKWKTSHRLAEGHPLFLHTLPSNIQKQKWISVFLSPAGLTILTWVRLTSQKKSGCTPWC